MQPRGEAEPNRSPENRRFEWNPEDYIAYRSSRRLRGVSAIAEGVSAGRRQPNLVLSKASVARRAAFKLFILV